MMEADPTAKARIRRTLECEFARMEDDFDVTRDHRTIITNKIMEAAAKVKLLDDDQQVTENTDTGVRVLTAALKALADTEKATAQAIALKLKNQEQEIASNSASKDRIAIILKATAPGRLEPEFPADLLEQKLDEMFSGDIQDFELKLNPRDIAE